MGLRSGRLSKNERQNVKDEQRLLFPGGQPKRDRDAIPIRPGQGPKKFEVFRPTDTLGPRSNAWAKAAPRSILTTKPLDLDPATIIPDSDAEEVTPPRKRLKMEKSKPEVIDLEDNEQPQTASASNGINQARQNSPPQTPVQKNEKQALHTSKYWPVENKVQKPAIKKKHRGRHVEDIKDGWLSSLEDELARSTREPRVKPTLPKGRPDDGCIPMVAVEIPKRAKVSERLNDSEVSSNNRSIPEDNIRSGRESPDELQGDKTVADSWRDRGSATIGTSPSDLRHSKFTTSSKPSQKTASRREDKQAKRKPVLFEISLLRQGDYNAGPLSHLVFDRYTHKFSISSMADSSSSQSKTFDLMKTIAMEYSEDPQCGKVRLRFPTSQSMVDRNMEIEFTSDHEKKKFLDLLRDASPSIKKNLRPRHWMEKLFDATPTQTATSDGTKASKLPAIDATVQYGKTLSTVKPKRVKLIDSLGTGDNAEVKRPSELLPHAHPAPDRTGAVAIPVKTYGKPVTRETRSNTRKQNIDIDSEEESARFTIFDRPGSGWQKPLLYPETGKKKAEVEAHDLERLRPHEFLNDNLIGLYIRFLEHHLERQHPDLAQRIYFFNSYFFATLTNSPKGQRGINYQGVAKWTRAFDIFAYDYLVVPINEKAHWYVAIICNLPNVHLQEDEEGSCAERDDIDDGSGMLDQSEMNPEKGITADAELERDTGTSDSPALDSVKESQIQESFTSMTLKDDATESKLAGQYPEDEPREGEEWPDEDENLPSSAPQEKETRNLFGQAIESSKPSILFPSEQKPAVQSKLAKKRSRRSRGPGIRYDPKQPSIIVFDSLDLPRSPTIRILREYLQEEAQSKRQLEIDPSRIKGINAKQIPHQPNYSDCGLYLLAYLEKFVQNPDLFIRSVLRKEMDRDKDWPAMKPGLFRTRLRDFLLKLYDEQEAQKTGKLNEGAPLMVDAKPLNILLDDIPLKSDSMIEDDTKEPREAVTPQTAPKSKGQTSNKTQALPTRSSPRHNAATKETTSVRSSPRYNTSTEEPTPLRSSPRQKFDTRRKDTSDTKLQEILQIDSSHGSFLAGLENYAAQGNRAGAGKDENGSSVEVPRTPIRTSPEIISSSPVSFRSSISSPRGRLKRAT